jgi:hypothetical protein
MKITGTAITTFHGHERAPVATLILDKSISLQQLVAIKYAKKKFNQQLPILIVSPMRLANLRRPSRAFLMR